MDFDFDRTAQAAIDALQNGNTGSAEVLSEQMDSLAPMDWRSLYVRGEIAYFNSMTDDAERLIRRAILDTPDKFSLRQRLAVILLSRRHRKAALVVAREIDLEARQDPAQLRFSAQVYSACNDEAAALHCLERAAILDPGNPGLLHDLALRQFYHGEVEAAERTIAQLFAATGANGTSAGHACYTRSLFRSHTVASNHVSEIEAMLAIGLHEGGGRSCALCGLARELEDLGEYARSAEAMRECARLVNEALKPDVGAELTAMKRLEAAWKTPPSNISTASSPYVPIFIVGLPRTGTTLTERILMRDPRVKSAGELPDFMLCLEDQVRLTATQHPDYDTEEVYRSIDLQALGSDYLRGALEATRDATIFVDKMPSNFRFTGIIAAALPNARIIHVARDPMDAAWAMHKTMLTQNMPWSHDLAQLADYIIGYTRLMDHWRQLFPERILTVRYEQLVADPRNQARSLLAWCGLQEVPCAPGNTDDAWRAVATPSALQVRQPINNRSVGKWRHYAELLEPVRARFQAAGLPV